MLISPEVMRIMELGRSVSNEAHLFREIARFTAVQGRVYVCHIEPKDDVALLVASHFADRMPSEYWLIVDDGRRYAVVHPVDSDMYVRRLTDQEMETLGSAEYMEDDYTDMWRTFFSAVGVEQRELQMPEKHVPFVVEKACHRIFGMIIEKMLELAGKI